MKKKVTNNKIYICYRNNSGLYMANEIADFLKKRGYKVFMNNSESTNLEICRMIELCDDFIIVLNEKALDGCINPNDLMKQEILYAHKLNKNIILAQDQIKFLQYPILPSELDFLKYLNWTTINPQLFSASMQVLIERLKATSRYRKILKEILWGIAGIVLCAFTILAYIFWPIPLKEVSDGDDIIISVPEEWTNIANQVDLAETIGGEQLLIYVGEEGGIIVNEVEDSLNIISSMSERTFIEHLKVGIASKGGVFKKSEIRNIYGEKVVVTRYTHNSYVYETLTLRGELNEEYFFDIIFYYSNNLNLLKKLRLSKNLNRIIKSFKELE